MRRPIHTPGPLYIDGQNIIANEAEIAIAKVYGNIGQPGEANSRLLAAAYNAFDSAARKLGINAVEFAERMQDGGLAELAESHEELLADIDGLKSEFAICREISRSSYAKRSRAILAKVKGAAK
jgi:hypothetical protein